MEPGGLKLIAVTGLGRAIIRMSRTPFLLEKTGGSRKRAAPAVPHIVAASDLVATVPHKLAERVTGPCGLAMRELPVSLPPFAVDLFWHRRVHQEDGHRWLREQLARWFAE